MIATIITSPDGINWTRRASPGDTLWAPDGAFSVGHREHGEPSALPGFGVGGIGSVNDLVLGPDGISYTARNAPIGHNGQVGAVFFDEQALVWVIGLRGTTTSGDTVIYTSPDFIHFTARLVTVGTAQASVSAISQVPGTWVDVAVGEAPDGGPSGIEVMTSTDGGVTWTLIPGGGPTDGSILDACLGLTDSVLGNRMLVGGSRLFNGTNYGPLALSTDDTATAFTRLVTPWDTPGSLFTSNVAGLAVGINDTYGSWYVAVGSHVGGQSVIVSDRPDGSGTGWILPASVPNLGGSNLPAFFAGGGVCYSGPLELFVAVGANALGQPTVMTAHDPSGTWTVRSTPIDGGGGALGIPVLQAVTWSDRLGLFCAVGAGGIPASTPPLRGGQRDDQLPGGSPRATQLGTSIQAGGVRQSYA